MAIAATSWLDTAEQSNRKSEPFFVETVELLRSVRDHDFDSLADLCDDDFGIVDLDQGGGSVMVRTRTEWENWFRRLFSELDAASAATDSEIIEYQAIATAAMGYSVVEFRQSLTMGGSTAYFDCVATIIWKHTEAGWKESRWHVSLLNTELPEGFATAS